MAKPAKDSASRGGEPAKAEPKPFLRRRIGLLAVVVVLGALGFAAVQLYQRPRETPDGAAKPPAVAAIGGPFSLVDQNGNAVTEAAFRGKFMLAYFGYTYCPDVCPTALTDIGNVLEALGPDADKVVPVFFTVDPERDTPEQLKEYLRFFHPRFVGLTGSADQMAAAKAYRVQSAKAKSKNDADALDYMMDHTAVIYLMGPEGGLKAHFSRRVGVDAMTKKIRELL